MFKKLKAINDELDKLISTSTDDIDKVKKNTHELHKVEYEQFIQDMYHIFGICKDFEVTPKLDTGVLVPGQGRERKLVITFQKGGPCYQTGILMSTGRYFHRSNLSLLYSYDKVLAKEPCIEDIVDNWESIYAALIEKLNCHILDHLKNKTQRAEKLQSRYRELRNRYEELKNR